MKKEGKNEDYTKKNMKEVKKKAESRQLQMTLLLKPFT